MLLEVALVLVEHTVQPGQELLGAVVGVQDDGDTVGRSDATDVVGTSNGAGDGGFLVGVCDALNGISRGINARRRDWNTFPAK